MAPLIVLVAATLLARLAGQLGATPLRNWPGATRAGVGGQPATPVMPRVALQLLFMGLVWWSGIREADERSPRVRQHAEVGR